MSEGYTSKGGGGSGGGGGDPIDALYDAEAGTDSAPVLEAQLAADAASDSILAPVEVTLQSAGGTSTTFDSVDGEVTGNSGARTDTDGSMDVLNLRCIADAWTDEDNPNTNHGSDPNLEVQQGILAVQGSRRGYMLFDCSALDAGWYEDAAAPVTTLQLYLSPPAVDIAATLTLRSQVYTTQPWTQSGLTWNNQPSHATTIATYNYPLLAGPSIVNIPLGAFASPNELIGNYLSVYATFEALIAVVGTFTIRARENASGPHPNISFRLLHI